MRWACQLDPRPLVALSEKHVRYRAERGLVCEEDVTRLAEQAEALGDLVQLAERERAEVVHGRVVVELRELRDDGL